MDSSTLWYLTAILQSAKVWVVTIDMDYIPPRSWTMFDLYTLSVWSADFIATLVSGCYSVLSVDDWVSVSQSHVMTLWYFISSVFFSKKSHFLLAEINGSLIKKEALFYKKNLKLFFKRVLVIFGFSWILFRAVSNKILNIKIRSFRIWLYI